MRGVIFVCLLITSFFPVQGYNLANYKKLALKGDISAQVHLGRYYSLGKQKNLKESYYWMRLAAQNGNPYASNQLGYCHLYGKGTSKDLKQSKEWFLKSAKLGYAPSMSYLGSIFEFEKDWIRSAAWYKMSNKYAQNIDIHTYNRVLKKIVPEKVNSVEELSKDLSSQIKKVYEHREKIAHRSLKNLSRIKLNSSIEYIGKKHEGIPHGYGKKLVDNKTVYIGEFRNGIEHGYGTSFGKDGMIKYEGVWRSGTPINSNEKQTRKSFTNY